MPRRKKVKKEAPQQDKVEAVPMNMPLDWQIPDNVATHYVTNMISQVLDHDHIKIMFFDVELPIIYKGGVFVAPQKGDAAKAKCVASIVFTTNHLKNMINSLIGQIKLQAQIPKGDIPQKTDK